MCAWALSTPTLAETLTFPVDCELGVSCVIQQYVDRDPGQGTADYTCGPLTYQGHNGTDIRLPNRAAMEAGVDVLSATAGVVLGLRDGMDDMRFGSAGAPDIKGRECGNGVLVQRKDGWRFQYCHLKKGSIAVRKGDAVSPGTVLGQIGLSGRTQFPHLHLSVRDQAGRVIDPFDARQQDESCRLRERETLWANAIDYQPGGPLAAGFADHAPSYEGVRAGLPPAVLDRNAPALVFWVHFFGLRKDDRIELSLVDPNGAPVVSKTHVMPRNRATEYRAAGRRARGPWPPGTYLAEASLTRDARVISRIQRRLVIE